MIPKSCKRLAEVDFPIAEVSRHAAREKSIRHGHPSTLHLWWARRPLASSRAVLMGLLLPDPCDPNCPEEFKNEARHLLLKMRGRPSSWDSSIKTEDGLRQALLKFIADFANWNNCAKREYWETSRGLVRAAHPEETPLVVDPFAGGGSIPLETLRVGCDSFASDLNPVAGLILKVILEDIPREGARLAEAVEEFGAEIRAKLKTSLSGVYPNDPDGSIPIAYLWARTVHCESPNCGAEIPLLRSMWLCRKPNRKLALLPTVKQNSGRPPQLELRIFEPKRDSEVAAGTVSRAAATCLCCNVVLPPERVRLQLVGQRGGADSVFDEKGNRIAGARLTAVVTLKPHQGGRNYRLPKATDYEAVRRAQNRVAEIVNRWQRDGSADLCPVPNEPLPPIGTLGFRVQRYGILRWDDLFTARQKLALAEINHEIRASSVDKKKWNNALGLVPSKLSDRCNSCVPWSASVECPTHYLTGNALPMAWDFAESNILTESTASLDQTSQNVARNIRASIVEDAAPGITQLQDAASHPLPDQSASIWFTDPPYYDSVPYADLSDFFLVWLKRAIPGSPLLQDPFERTNTLSNKNLEIVQDNSRLSEGQPKSREWFEQAMAKVFAEGRRTLDENGIGAVVFAHKTTEGWEALLSGMIRGGWTITGSWPIATERYSRLRARESAALATSVHLICRPRAENAPTGEWAHLLQELPQLVAAWMQRLQREGIRGADLVFACVGPALEIYSRYSKVETAEGNLVNLPEYLERLWEVVGREALEQVLGTAEAQARNGAAGALEEDARLTALFLWTLQSTTETGNKGAAEFDEGQEAPQARVSGFSLPFDVARRFAQPLGIHMEDWEKRIIQTEKGVVKLRPVMERASELFGESGTDSRADDIESAAAGPAQMTLFPEEAPAVRGGRSASQQGQEPRTSRDATTLDRVHAAMLLQASGRTQALRNLLRAEQDRGPDFLRLANALSALYPRGCDEKRLLDGMLLAAPR